MAWIDDDREVAGGQEPLLDAFAHSAFEQDGFEQDGFAAAGTDLQKVGDFGGGIILAEDFGGVSYISTLQ